VFKKHEEDVEEADNISKETDDDISNEADDISNVGGIGKEAEETQVENEGALSFFWRMVLDSSRPERAQGVKVDCAELEPSSSSEREELLHKNTTICLSWMRWQKKVTIFFTMNMRWSSWGNWHSQMGQQNTFLGHGNEENSNSAVKTRNKKIKTFKISNDVFRQPIVPQAFLSTVNILSTQYWVQVWYTPLVLYCVLPGMYCTTLYRLQTQTKGYRHKLQATNANSWATNGFLLNWSSKGGN
jgi:hypothetical protein